jgi:hypothetical protein
VGERLSQRHHEKERVGQHAGVTSTTYLPTDESRTARKRQAIVEAVLALGETDDLERDLGQLARRFLGSLRQPQVLQLRRLIIGEAGRFPALGRTYWREGFERALATLAAGFQRLVDRGLLRLDDPLFAAQHFAGLVLWIPMNQVMFNGGESVDGRPARTRRRCRRARVSGCL